ncbi:hypothetical protein B0J12DRAFT_735064 [Macrophomina phaseolina]|uniref:Carboxymuconolactone decarboxylase n=1 Tax=Macrophomina phaseolina TaxID=35725 RepID=A0ABQ8GUS0_9PEZI|nr:hypothetical protein B0J12DRAFT_735064 [Macrophomina phaseolina]
MGSVVTFTPSVPAISQLSALFPADPRGPAYSIAYVHAGVTLLALGADKRIPELWQHVARAHTHDAAAQITAATRVREGLVKASPLLGFPRAINALAALRAAVHAASPPDVAAAVYAPPRSRDSCREQKCPGEPRRVEGRGARLFAQTYGQHAARVQKNLDAISGDALGGFAVECIYGELLAEERLLDARESAALVFVACVAAGAGPQAKGHMYGARNLGNSGEEIAAAVEVVRRVAEGLGMEVDWEEMEFLEKVRDW